jgi:hypothetical protein
MATPDGNLLVAILVLVILALAAPGVAQARVRPTFSQAHGAAHLTLDDYAEIVDGRLTVGPCRREGGFTTVCRARIDGPLRERYRILVTGTPARDFLVTVRPLDASR